MKEILYLLISATLVMSTPCLGEPASSDRLKNWKTECIGRYQISVPGDVEIIFKSPSSLSTLSTNTLKALRSNQYPAIFSLYDYYGEIGITPEAPKTDFEHLRMMIKTGLIEEKKKLLNEALKFKKDGYPSLAKHNFDRINGFRPMDYDTPIKFGWGLSHPRIYLYQSNRIFTYESAQGNDELLKKQFNLVVNDLRPRSLYELPNREGVCLPYSFIPDDGSEVRDIGVTMRLIDHPDVEIFFRDTSSYLTGGTLHSPKDEIEYFWTIMYQKYTKLTEADFWGYRSIKMGGQAGKGMFATIHRYDDTIDYGYIAVVSDNANLPSQMLYVIRTATRAKGKPVSKDELKDIAEKIMASVKPHAVQ